MHNKLVLRMNPFDMYVQHNSSSVYVIEYWTVLHSNHSTLELHSKCFCPIGKKSPNRAWICYRVFAGRVAHANIEIVKRGTRLDCPLFMALFTVNLIKEADSVFAWGNIFLSLRAGVSVVFYERSNRNCSPLNRTTILIVELNEKKFRCCASIWKLIKCASVRN